MSLGQFRRTELSLAAYWLDIQLRVRLVQTNQPTSTSQRTRETGFYTRILSIPFFLGEYIEAKLLISPF